MKAVSIQLLLGLFSLVSADKYGYNHVTVRKDTDIIASIFQDVDIDLLSPSFLTPELRQPGFASGTQGPISHDDLDSFLQDLANKNSFMTYKKPSFTSEEVRSFPYIHLASRSSLRQEKVRVWIQGVVHGNEPAGEEAILALLGRFDKQCLWTKSILDKLEIVILPRYNPDGVYYFQRTLPSNYDPNRDHVKLARQQTREIKKLLNEFKPHIIVDMHEYGSSARFGGGRYGHASDGLFSAAKNLNINKNIRSLAEELFAKNMGEAMEDAGLRWEPYVTGSSASGPEYIANFAEAGTDAKIGRNAMGLTQAVVFLVELRGIGLADQEFQRRTVSGYTMLSSIVQTAADNGKKVFDTIEGGISEFVSSTEDIVVTDYSDVIIRPWTMVDVNNGTVVQMPVRFASTTPANANLTRSRPEAYLIPAGWADLAERLRVSGLEVETLSKPWSGVVEAHTITKSTAATGYYEGVFLVTVETRTAERQLTLPPGSFLVSTRQKNAALAFMALEPENIDSYVSFNIVPAEVGDEYPIFRVMS